MNKLLFIGVCKMMLGLGIVNVCQAQTWDSCRVDYAFLLEDVSIDVTEVEAGGELKLRDTFIQLVETQPPLHSDASKHKSFEAIHNLADFQSKEIYHYQYLRPAARKELKSMTVAESDVEIILPDSNVYTQAKLAEPTVFYQVTHHFGGDYSPEVRSDRLIVPTGLVPGKIDSIEHQQFVLIAKKKDYWIFESMGEQWVFYPQAFSVQEIFQMPEKNTALAQKIKASENIKGQLLMKTGEEVQDAWEIMDVGVKASEVQLGIRPLDSTKGKEVMYIELKPETVYKIYRTNCIQRIKKAEALALAKQKEIETSYLERLAQTKLPISAIHKEPVAKEILTSKFELVKGPMQAEGWYIHEDLRPENMLNVSLIKLNLNERGEIYLQSVLSVDTAFHHIQLSIQLGEDLWKSPKIYKYNHRNVATDFEGFIQESIHFSTNKVPEIIEKIGENIEEPVWITFFDKSGRSHKIALSQKHKLAIRDTFLLYRYLTFQNSLKAEIGN